LVKGGVHGRAAPAIRGRRTRSLRRAKALIGELGGSGAFKHTFRATAADGSHVALKVYKSTSARDAREVSALKRCNHPSIARLFDVGAWPLNGTSYTYSLEEFLDGGTLTRRFASGILDGKRVLDLGTPLIGAVGTSPTLTWSTAT